MAFLIECYSCATRFDAEAAEWCSCIASDRTLLCPKCGHCFCEAPSTYQRDFYVRAPKALLAKRDSLDGRPPTILLSDEIRSPLVLVADDDRLTVLLATRAVQKLGYGIITARTGMEALEHARIYHPDIILSDALMPGIDGRELCRRIKNDPVLTHVPVAIITSVYGSDRYRAEALGEYGADEYLLKPIGFAQLEQLLLKYVGRPLALA